MKDMFVVKMVVGDGPLVNIVHIMLILGKKKKSRSSGNEMTPLDLLSFDIFVYQPG